MIVDAARLAATERAALGITTPLPKSLDASLAALETDDALRELLGQELVQNYSAVKWAEQERLQLMPEKMRRLWLLERY